ncbi:unnamed protein product [Orchesella dallaii]|uniref:Uncharacterized protein n=1 Tax=Orchesella dallaii TaxID=48710 RepID=A0ABP1R346_9HEXA
MDQSKPNEDHCLHSPNLPENVTAASFNFYNSHYLAHQPENSKCLPPLSHQNSSITVPNIQHHQSQSVPELAPNVPSQQISCRHELIYSLSQQQKSLQFQRNYRTQRRQQQPHFQNIRQQLSDIRTIQLINSQHIQNDPPMNSETQASIYQTDLIIFQSQEGPMQHPIPHALSAELIQPPEYTRETRSDNSDTHNLELELQSKEDTVKALTKQPITNQIEITLFQQQCKDKEQKTLSELSHAGSHQTELERRNIKVSQVESNIGNLNLILGSSNKTAQSLHAENEILSSDKEGLKSQVQILQKTNSELNAQIGMLKEENHDLAQSVATSNEKIKENNGTISELKRANEKLKQEAQSIHQQQDNAKKQVIKKLRIENNELPVLKRKIETLSNLQRETPDKKEELDKKVEDFKKKVTSLSHELKEAKIKHHRDLKKERQKVENEFKDVVDSNENLKGEVTNLTAKNQTLNEKIDTDAKKHKDQIIFLFSIIKSRKNVIIDLRNKNLEMTVSSSKNRPQSKKLLESNQDYEQKLAAASATLHKTLKENVDLKQELAKEKNNVEQKSKHISKLKNMLKDVNAKNEVLGADLGQLRAQLNNKSKINIELQIEKDSSNKANTKHCSKIQELTRKLRVQGATNENNLQEKQHEIDSQKVQIRNQKRSLESYESKISELQNADAENVKKLKMTEDNFKHQLKGLHAYYKSKEIDWKAGNSKLEEKLMTAKEGTKYADKENEMRKQTIQEMEKKMTEVHAENKEMEKKMTEVHAENKEMEKKMAEVHSENKEMERKMSELRAKNKELQRENAIFIKKETIARLQDEQRRLFETNIKGVGDDVKVLCSKMTPGADSNLECRLGASSKVVSKDDCKVRVGPSTEGFRSVITVTTRLAKGKNHHRHQGLNPAPLMSLRLPNPFTLEHTTVLHKRKEGDMDHTSHISKMNRIIGGVKHDNDKNETTLKRKLCNEEADRCQLQQETQLSPDSTYEVKNESVAPLEETAAKKNPIDCEYPPKKRICVNDGNIPMGLDEANGLDELEEGEIP